MLRLPPAVTELFVQKGTIDDELYMRFRINKDSTTTVCYIEIYKVYEHTFFNPDILSQRLLLNIFCEYLCYY